MKSKTDKLKAAIAAIMLLITYLITTFAQDGSRDNTMYQNRKFRSTVDIVE